MLTRTQEERLHAAIGVLVEMAPTEEGSAVRLSPLEEVPPRGLPRLAWAAAGIAIVLAVALPIVFLTTPQPLASEPPTSAPSVSVAPPPETPVESFPLLFIEHSGQRSYEITDHATGARVGTHSTFTNISDSGTARMIELRVQTLGQSYDVFAGLVALAESEEVVRVGDRDITVFVVPDEAIEEGSYDLGVLRWVETPGIEVILIPWGFGRDEAVRLITHVVPLSEERWFEMVQASAGATTTTTIVITEDPAGG